MKRTHVSSSAIRSIGYDAELHLLEIEYVSGDVYLYYYVPEDEYEQLTKAESKGIYVNQRIKPKYPYNKAAA
ncbi:MAG: hypothetical protein AUG74_14140 [Bacteroidetes bacterium 13_1_20CM_4_60_6]|nr:MAG: hypothetical protein AUG74_14140 [Bacteroidetes bacterium 13_1_20CM_4_60_6]